MSLPVEKKQSRLVKCAVLLTWTSRLLSKSWQQNCSASLNCQWHSPSAPLLSLWCLGCYQNIWLLQKIQLCWAHMETTVVNPGVREMHRLTTTYSLSFQAAGRTEQHTPLSLCYQSWETVNFDSIGCDVCDLVCVCRAGKSSWTKIYFC